MRYSKLAFMVLLVVVTLDVHESREKTGEAYTRLPMMASNEVQQVGSSGFTSLASEL
jgi:hypothetical protein